MAGDAASPVDTAMLGTGWSFPPRFDSLSKGAHMVSQVQDVHESLRILLGTVPGERVMQPGYGCGLQRMVFEPITETTLTEMRSLIEQAVLFFEPRVQLEQVEFDVEDLLGGVLRIELDYTIRTTNTRHNLVFPLYLEQGRGDARTAAVP